MDFSHYIEEKAKGAIELSVKGPFAFVYLKDDVTRIITLTSIEDQIKLLKDRLYNLEALQKDLKTLQAGEFPGVCL